jgi:hypothetical protein
MRMALGAGLIVILQASTAFADDLACFSTTLRVNWSGGVPKGPSGQKRSTCPAGCQAADPTQSVFPMNQLVDAGAVGAWLRLIAIRCTFCGCVHTGAAASRTIRAGMTASTQDGWQFMPKGPKG